MKQFALAFLIMAMAAKVGADSYTFIPTPAGEAALDYVTKAENEARAKLNPPEPPVTKGYMFTAMVKALMTQYEAEVKQKQLETFQEKYKALTPANKSKVDELLGAPVPK